MQDIENAYDNNEAKFGPAVKPEPQAPKRDIASTDIEDAQSAIKGLVESNAIIASETTFNKGGKNENKVIEIS